MASVTAFDFMSSYQKDLEHTWYNVMVQLVSATGNTAEVVLSSDLKNRLGDDGVAAIAQRCSTFRDAHVEVKNDDLTGTVRINMLAPGSRGQTVESTATSAESSDSSKKVAKVTRPPNAFICYRRQKHEIILAQNPGIHNNDISKIVGKMWHDEPESVKQIFKDQANELKRQHARNHPGYQYQPRKPGEKKRRMSKRKAMALAAQDESNPHATAIQNPSAGTIGMTVPPVVTTTEPYGSATSAAQVIDMGVTAADEPSFEYSADGDLTTFTLDTYSDGQIQMLADMIDQHNKDFNFPEAQPPVDMPAVAMNLPTAINHAQGNMQTTAGTANAGNAPLTSVDNVLTTFDDSLEQLLAQELEAMDNIDMPESIEPTEFNDIESQRFSEFIEQMPEGLWGMEYLE